MVLACVGFAMALGLAQQITAFYLAGGSQPAFDAMDHWLAVFDVDSDGLRGPARLAMPAFFIANLTFFAVVLNRALLQPETEDGEQFDRQVLNQLGLVTAIYGGAAAFALLMSAPFDWLCHALGAPRSMHGVGTVIADLATIYALVKLSLASPATFVTGRIDLLASWRLTKGWFRTILFAWLLGMILGVVALVLVTAAHFGLDDLAGPAKSSGQLDEAASLSALLSPTRLAWSLSAGTSDGLFWMMMLAPLPAIYARLRAADPPTKSPPLPLTPRALAVSRVGIGLMILGWGGLVVMELLGPSGAWVNSFERTLGSLGALGLSVYRMARIRRWFGAA